VSYPKKGSDPFSCKEILLALLGLRAVLLFLIGGFVGLGWNALRAADAHSAMQQIFCPYFNSALTTFDALL
jgi:hypothetical protein